MHFLILSFVFYFVPAIIAAARHTHNATAILLLNLFLGWTVIGWFVAFLTGPLFGSLLRPLLSPRMVSTGAGSPEPRWEIRDWLAAAGLFLATAGVVLWQNAHVAVLFDSATFSTRRSASLGPDAVPRLSPGARAADVSYSGRDHSAHGPRLLSPRALHGFVGGLGTVLAWRIGLRSLRGRVTAAWPAALLVGAPLCVLGIYSILPNPEYDCDCGFWILVAVWMVQQLDARTGLGSALPPERRFACRFSSNRIWACRCWLRRWLQL